MSAIGTKKKADRNANDFYETPEWCTRLLLGSMEMPEYAKIVEPCAGHGAIVDVIRDVCGGDVGIASPHPAILQYELVHNKKLSGYRMFVDFLLLEEHDALITHVITNPPFSLAREFIEHSLHLYPYAIIIMLLPLDYMGSHTRHDFWKKNPPSEIKVLSDRPSFTGKGTAASNYAWFHWRTNPEKPISFLSRGDLK